MGEHRVIEPALMTVDAWLDWAVEQEGRHELEAGVVVEVAPEMTLHALVKGQIYRVIHAAMADAGLPGLVFPDGATVRIDAMTAYEPDVTVQAGAGVDLRAMIAEDPQIVVEVLSPSTARRDTGVKLAGYFRVESILHYLIVDPEERLVIHHARAGDTIRTSTLRGGTLTLDPPGITLAHADLFIPEPAP